MQRVTVVKPSRAVGFVRRHDSESAKSFVSSGVSMGWLLRLVTGGPGWLRYTSVRQHATELLQHDQDNAS